MPLSCHRGVYAVLEVVYVGLYDKSSSCVCRIHEQYRRLQEKQHQIDAANRLREDHLRNMHTSALNTSSGHEADSAALASLSRAERIQHLRSEHQRRHRERQGQYPLDAQEEAYEHQLQEYEKQVSQRA